MILTAKRKIKVTLCSRQLQYDKMRYKSLTWTKSWMWSA